MPYSSSVLTRLASLNLGGGSEVFGATSINSTIAFGDINTANGVNAEITAGTKADNNIATNGSQQLNTTGVISIAGISIAGDGSETVDGTIDVTISGVIGKIIGEGDVTFDASSESTNTKDALAQIALNNADFAYDSASNTYKLTAGDSVDFGNIEFSALDTESNTAKKQLTLNVGGRTDDNSIALSNTFSISNNIAANREAAGSLATPSAGQLNIHTNSTSGNNLTGGKLISELKNLEANELTAAIANEFMATIDEAMSQLNANRSDFGSTQNQLESSIRNMQTTQTNLKAAESVVRDVDYAAESATFNKQNIIAQAGTYAMSQANSMAQIGRASCRERV